MSNEQQDDWVQARTPNDEDFGEDAEESEYGHAYQPEEWDDYASEQSAPVAPPQPRVESETSDQIEDRSWSDDQGGTEEPETAPDPLGEEVPAEDAAPVAEPEQPLAEPLIDADQAVDEQWAGTDQDVAEPADAPADPLPWETNEPGYGAEGYGGVADDVDDAPADEFDPALEETAVRPAADPYGAPEQTDDELPAGLIGEETVDEAKHAGTEESVFQDPDAKTSPGADEPVAEHALLESDDTAWEDEAAPTDESASESETALIDEAAPETDTVPTDEPDPEEDPDATQAIPVAVLPDEAALTGAAPAPASEPSPEDDALDQVYRDDENTSSEEAATEQLEQPDGPPTQEHTQVLAPASEYPELDEQEAEEQRIQDQLAAERQARRERLGVVETSDANASRGPQIKPKRTTDKFVGAFPMFLLRLITAAVVGVTGYQMLTPVEETAAVLEPTILPEPLLMSWILGFTLAGIAVFLVLGLLQRVVGLLLMVYSIGLLAILRWGPFDPFRQQFEGFAGDKELLLAGIGFLLLMVGGGSWGIDGAVRAGRAKSKAEQEG